MLFYVFSFLCWCTKQSVCLSHMFRICLSKNMAIYFSFCRSQKKASVYYSYRSELEKIDLDSLREAERKLWDRINSYSERQEPLFTVHAKDGEVRLYVELIVIYDPPHIPDWPTSPDPTAPTPPQRGCGIDHDHLKFYEVISEQPTEPPAEPPTESTKEEVITGNTEGPPLTHETIVP